MATDFSEARTLIAGSLSPVVVSHLRPDGDAVGSLLSMTLSLQASNRNAVPVLVDGLPERFRFLPGSDQIRTSLPSDPDLLICIDCSDQDRTGLPMEAFHQCPVLNIDHHPTNTGFGSVNYILPQAAAAVEIVYALLQELRFSLDEAVRINLLVGLLADTIGFRTSNVHPGTLRMAAELLEQGTDLPGLYDLVLNQRTLESARYWGYGLQKIQLEKGVVWTSLSLAEKAASGYLESDDADLINVMSTIDRGLVSILFMEQPDGKVKVSWRAREGVDVAELAMRFGGGGHKPAAGAMIDGTLEEIQNRVLAETITYVETTRD